MPGLTALTPQALGVLIAVAALGFLVGRASARMTAPRVLVPEPSRVEPEAPERERVLQPDVEELLRAKDEEIGRLETGALTAIERTITRFRDQVQDLERELRDVRARYRELDLRAGEESKRASRLQDAITDRDAHLASLREELQARS